ncbi:MAG: hydrogenase maturation protease [Anaerolineae bacterium]|nr:hydrogenase maturation protease [Anaerolineae bacterium]
MPSKGRGASRTLIVGFGNLYRRDDGVALAVVNALRERLGRPPLGEEDDGFDDLGHPVDTVLLHQLVPDLAEVVAGYDLVVFVDAHVESVGEPLHEEELMASPKEALVPHQMHPCTVLALAHSLHGARTRGVLLSLRGHDFDFGVGLSPETAALVPRAVARLLALAGVEGGAG